MTAVRFRTYGLERLTRAGRFVGRHRRVVGVVALLLVTLGVVGTLMPHPESDDPTSATSRAEWAIAPSDGGEPTIRFQIDQRSGWTRVIDSRLAEPFFVHDGRVLVAMSAEFAASTGRRYVSIPVELLFPRPLNFSPAQLAPSLDRRPKECTEATEIEAAYVQYFLGEAMKDSTSYFICGSAVFTGEASRLLGAEKWLSEVDHPVEEDSFRIEDVGVSRDQVLAEIRTELGQT